MNVYNYLKRNSLSIESWMSLNKIRWTFAIIIRMVVVKRTPPTTVQRSHNWCSIDPITTDVQQTHTGCWTDAWSAFDRTNGPLTRANIILQQTYSHRLRGPQQFNRPTTTVQQTTTTVQLTSTKRSTDWGLKSNGDTTTVEGRQGGPDNRRQGGPDNRGQGVPDNRRQGGPAVPWGDQ